MSETSIKSAVMLWLRQQGCYVVKIHGDAMQEAGVPDLIGVLPTGRGFGLELKVPKQWPSALQRYHLDKIAKAGGAQGCAHSLDEAKEWYARAIA